MFHWQSPHIFVRAFCFKGPKEGEPIAGSASGSASVSATGSCLALTLMALCGTALGTPLAATPGLPGTTGKGPLALRTVAAALLSAIRTPGTRLLLATITEAL